MKKDNSPEDILDAEYSRLSGAATVQPAFGHHGRLRVPATLTLPTFEA